MSVKWHSIILDQPIDIESWLSKQRNRKCLFFLDSSSNEVAQLNNDSHLTSKSRYSYIGINPYAGLSYYGDRLEVHDSDGLRMTEIGVEPNIALTRLEEYYEEHSIICNPHFPEREPQWFIGFSYDFGELMMGLREWQHNIYRSEPYFFSWLPGDQVVIDWHTMQLTYWSIYSQQDNLYQRFTQLFSSPEQKNDTRINAINPRFLFDRAKFIESINKIKHSIYEGDVYLTNMTQPFYFESESNKLDIYIKLRSENPSPFGAAIIMPNFSILSSSPERFLYMRNRNIYTEPIKGTRPRGKTEQEDDGLYNDLISSIKERAEHTMVVDLLRNDVSKICQYGSVCVEDAFYIEKYRTVFQLVSRIKGRLLPNVSLINVITEIFPGGSITGSPKLSAMNIIDKTENFQRGFYTGCLGRQSISGESFDLSILIRSIFFNGNKGMIGVGGGIVYDSVPHEEFQETLDKGRAIVQLFNQDLIDYFLSEDCLMLAEN